MLKKANRNFTRYEYKDIQYIACMRKVSNLHIISVGKSDGKRLLKRPRPRYKDNIQINFRELGYKHLAQIGPRNNLEIS